MKWIQATESPKKLDWYIVRESKSIIKKCDNVLFNPETDTWESRISRLGVPEKLEWLDESETIPSVTNEEDELWELTKKKLLDLMVVEGKIKEVRKVMRSVAIVFESGSAYWLRLEKQSDVSLDD